jgi:3-methyladenine DNA glycosylase AlkD
MTAKAILEELKPLGRENIKKILLTHGAKEPCLGVKIEELKMIQKRIKKDYRLALDLYDTGVYDAMYLAGLIADDARMTKKDLQHWVAKSENGALAGATVPWVTTGSSHGWDLALEWIESKKEHVAVAGWGTLSCLVSIKDDAELDLEALKRLLRRVQQTIQQAPNDVRYQMNGFVIAVGAYVQPLTALALQTAEEIGPVHVDLATAGCKVPFAADYIRKVEKRGSIGKKRKSVKC